MDKYVYMGGGIEGLTWEEAGIWREQTANRFREECIRYHNPCGYIPIELRRGIITADRLKNEGMFTGDEIYTQDMFYLKNLCNIYLINLDNPGRFTLIEWGIAHSLALIIIGFGGIKTGNKDYFPIRIQADCLFNTREEAIDFIIAI